MSLRGATNEEKIRNYLKDKGLNDFGVAGLMGNLYAESALNPKNLQQTFEKKLGMTDESYTEAVDNGKYDNFVKDSAGYGLAQWTYWSRKESLLNFAKDAGKSIGDLECQLDFLYRELSRSYKTVLSGLKKAKSVLEASNLVLTKYEKPADQGEAVQKKRAGFGQKYYDKFVGGSTGNEKTVFETEAECRQALLDVARGWLGYNEKDGSHKEIVDLYNSHTPLAQGYKVTYKDEWCATYASAVAIKAGMTDIIPTECGCQRMIALFIEKKSWEEADHHIPAPADYIFYDWQDSGVGDNEGWADHVGIVESVSNGVITVIEGNQNDSVMRKNIKVNSKTIRGFGVPKYDTKAEKKEEPNTSGKLKIGDIVEFVGTMHYRSSSADAKGLACRSGKARITNIKEGGSHPYHLVAVSGGSSNVYGWVDVADIKGAEAPTEATIGIGDIVEFTGTVHYTSCYMGAVPRSCVGGKAKVTAIRRDKPHPYHLIHTGKGCTVYGWVDVNKVKK